MTPRTGKVRSGAVCPLVDVESEKSCFALLWQAGNPRHNQHTASFLVKLYPSGQLRRICPTANTRHRIRTLCAMLHKITSYQPIPNAVFCNKVLQRQDSFCLCDGPLRKSVLRIYPFAVPGVRLADGAAALHADRGTQSPCPASAVRQRAGALTQRATLVASLTQVIAAKHAITTKKKTPSGGMGFLFGCGGRTRYAFSPKAKIEVATSF